jgi:hypothetical protein
VDLPAECLAQFVDRSPVWLHKHGDQLGQLVTRPRRGWLIEPARQRRHTDGPQPGLRDPQAEATVVIGPPRLVGKPDRDLLDGPLAQQAQQDAFECHAARSHRLRDRQQHLVLAVCRAAEQDQGGVGKVARGAFV